MNSTTNASVGLSDGIFFAPTEFVDSLLEEYHARGGNLTVAEAAALCEKWARPPKA